MSILGKLIGATVRGAALPVAVAADCLTLGNVGKKETYTGEQVRKIGEDVRAIERDA